MRTGIAFVRYRSVLRALLSWSERGFAAPAPAVIKHAVLRRAALPDAPWVETGTLHGETAAFLASIAPLVITLEPMPELFRAASARLAPLRNVEVRNATSEVGFAAAAGSVGGRINFWLDGHYSGGDTFLGDAETPISVELAAIAELVRSGAEVAVLIDDVRLFVAPPGERTISGRTGYPPLDLLSEWARELGLIWWIEHDIFVARSQGPTAL